MTGLLAVASDFLERVANASHGAQVNDSYRARLESLLHGAGPNTSPRRLWAIIMWSRTVTLNTRYTPS